MSVKSRLYRLKKRVARLLEQAGYEVIFPGGDCQFHVIAFLDGQKRNIFVSLDPPKTEIVRLVSQIQAKGKKEIAYRDGKKVKFLEISRKFFVSY